MSHIVIAGAPTGCWTNLGDEAILAGMADALRRTIPDVRITVIASSPAETYPPYGCESVPINDMAAVADSLATAGVFLLGGGSIFFDYWGCDADTVLTDRHAGATIWAGLALLAAAHDVPIMTYDLGLTPLRTQDGLLVTRAALQLADVVTVRDNDSADLARRWGIRTDKIVVTGDPAIAARLGTAASGEQAAPGIHGGRHRGSKPGSKPGSELSSEPGSDLNADRDSDGGSDRDYGPVLAVALREWDTGIDDQDQWNAALAVAIDTYLDHHTGSRALFVPCHRARPWPQTDDEAAAAAVIGHMRHGDRAETIPVDRPWQERAAALTDAAAVLAMRYHGALFALGADVPTVGLSYDAKVRGLFADFGVEERCFGLAEAADDPERLAAALVGATAGTAEAAARMRSAEQQAAVIAARLLRREQPTIVPTDDTDDGARESGPSAAQSPGPSAARTRRAHEAKQVPPVTAPPPWRPGHDDAVRELFRRIDLADPTRPPAVRDALTRLAAARDLAPHRPTVAILTNRLVSRAKGTPQIGGAERYALSLARLLRDVGMDVTFYQGGGDFETADFFGFAVHPIPFGEKICEFQTGVADEFARLTQDADHVLYLMPNYASPSMRDDAVLVSHGVWWDHDLWDDIALRSPEWYELSEKIYSAPARIISVDANTGNVLRAMMPAVADRIRHIPSSIDTEVFVPPAVEPGTETRDGDTAPLVLFPRRAERIRGSHLVEPIMHAVPDPCRFRWVGGGSDYAALRDLADRDPRLSVKKSTFADMPKHYAAADICVIPTVASEGQSLSALEAMASGCAVVVTRVGGLVELVTDGVDGIVCEPTAASLATAVRRLVRDPGLRRRLGAAARETALRHSETTWRVRWTQQLAELGWVDAAAVSTAAAYDVVKFPALNFEQRYQRPQQTAVAWGRRGRRVFYIQRTGAPPADGAPYRITPMADNVYAVQLALPPRANLAKTPADPETTAAAMRALELLRDAWHIDSAISFAEFGTWQPIVAAARERWNWPIHYDCMDNWSSFPGVGNLKAMLSAERELVRTADSMTVSARKIQQHWAAERPDAVLARNAADFQRFHTADPGDVPAPIADIAGPIAGFIGDVTWWFDVEIVHHIATARPEVHFVFVGNVKKFVDLTVLDDLANVHFLGLQPYEDMPRYVQRFTVCTVPFTVDAATESMDLVKIYEYFAAGKPIVTTPVSEMVRYGRELYLADGPDEFLAQLDAALAEDDPDAVARRAHLARLNSWDDRIDVIEEAIAPAIAARDEVGGTLDRIAAVERRARSAEGKLKRAVRRSRAAEATLQTLESSRAMRVVRHYWRLREQANRVVRGGRRAAGSAYRKLRSHR